MENKQEIIKRICIDNKNKVYEPHISEEGNLLIPMLRPEWRSEYKEYLFDIFYMEIPKELIKQIVEEK